MSSIGRELGRGLAWQYAGVAVQAGAQLAVLTILARLLPPSDFGVVSAAMIIIGFAGLFGQLGVAPAIIQAPTIAEEDVRSGFTLSLITGFVILAALKYCAPFIGAYFGNDEIGRVVGWVAWVFPIAGVGTIAEALLQRDLRFRAWTSVHLGSYVFGYASVAIPLAAAGMGVWALVIGTLTQRIFQTAASYAIVRHSVRLRLSLREYQRLLSFGVGHTLGQVLNYTANQGDYAVVGRVFDAAALGIYSRAYQLMMLPARYVGQALERVLFPVMARLQDDREGLRLLYLQSVAAINLVVAPMAALMVALAPEIVHVLLGDNWEPVVGPFVILSIGAIFRTSYKVSDCLAKAAGAVYRRSLREAVYALVVVGGSAIGARWGLDGVAVGVLVAIICNFTYASAISIGMLEIPWWTFVTVQLRSGAMGAVAAVLAWTIRQQLGAAGVGPAGTLIVAGGVAIAASGIIGLARPEMFGAEAAAALNWARHRLELIFRKGASAIILR